MLSVSVLSALNMARRCLLCGGPACVFSPGAEAEWASRVITLPDGSTRRQRRLIAPAVDEVSLCLEDSRRWRNPRAGAPPVMLVSV
jgi:hypothetical protein